FSKDDTAPGANSIHGDTDSKTPDFVSTTSGSEDFHLQSTSDAINVGTDLSGTFTDDIDGDTRPIDAWDIGADEEVEINVRIRGGVKIDGGVRIEKE
ncbi:MAG: choice-of-anchor Q domain-containing protein, partial [Patescibacteria group bacterium]|nr:choice-of-anchor Q domain-containing protein [Patescibacteria group bacterium]